MKNLRFFLFPILIYFVFKLGSLAYAAETAYCPFDSNPSRPGGPCQSSVPFLHTDIIDQYALTKLLRPEAAVQGSVCNAPPRGISTGPDGNYVEIAVDLNILDPELGGLGADAATQQNYAADVLKRFYLYHGLGEKPLGVDGAPREAFGSFWRLLNITQQLNAKAKFLSAFRTQSPPIFNSEFPYLPAYSTSAYQSSVPTSPTASGTVKQHLFLPSCEGTNCYEYITSKTSTTPACSGRYLNPDLAIAIALNEDGGLASTDPQARNIKHFGCDPFCVAGIDTDIPGKFGCMTRTLSADCGKTDSQILAEYGYQGVRNLNVIINLLGGCTRSAESTTVLCADVFVSQPTAAANAGRLNNLLPTQTDLWQRYYSGFLRDFTTTTVSCSGETTGTSAPASGSYTSGIPASGSFPRHASTPPQPISASFPGSVCPAGQIDVLEYIYPKDPNVILEMKNQENFQSYPSTINGQPAVIFNKQTKINPAVYYEEYTYDNNYIYHMRDTTWDQKCTDGTRAYASTFDPSTGQEGGPYIHRCVVPGQHYNISTLIKGFNRDTCQPCSTTLFGDQAVAGTEYSVEQKNGPHGPEIWVISHSGSGSGETKVFAKGLGLVGFQDSAGFSGAPTDNVAAVTSGDIVPIANTCKPVTPLDAPTYTLNELLTSLPHCLTNYPVCDNAVNLYHSLPSELKQKYDAFEPFDFDSVRGYIVMQHLDYESGKPSAIILRENLPYVLAVDGILNDESFGVVSALSPDWVNNQRRKNLTRSQIASDPNHTITNNQPTTEESLPIYRRLITDILNFARRAWDNSSIPFWEGGPGTVEIDGQKITPQMSLPSEQTYPSQMPGTRNDDWALWVSTAGSLSQHLRIPVKVSVHPLSLSCEGGTEYRVEYDASRAQNNNQQPLFSNLARETVILSNPLLKDISCSTSECQGSLYHQMMPQFALDAYKDYPMEGQADVTYSSGNPSPDYSVTVKDRSLNDDGESNIPRKGGAAHIDTCLMRNLWFMPQDLQHIKPEDCYNPPLN